MLDTILTYFVVLILLSIRFVYLFLKLKKRRRRRRRKKESYDNFLKLLLYNAPSDSMRTTNSSCFSSQFSWFSTEKYNYFEYFSYKNIN